MHLVLRARFRHLLHEHEVAPLLPPGREILNVSGNAVDDRGSQRLAAVCGIYGVCDAVRHGGKTFLAKALVFEEAANDFAAPVLVAPALLDLTQALGIIHGHIRK